MKRCFTRIRNWFIQWVRKMSVEERIGVAIGGMIGIIVGIYLFVSIDKVPATAMDYELLEKQMIAIQQNPDLLLETNGNISINNDLITVKFSNDECELIAKYNKNLELLSVSKIDNYTFWLLALVLSIFAGIVIYVYATLIVTLVVFFLEILWKFIHNRLNLIKTKKE